MNESKIMKTLSATLVILSAAFAFAGPADRCTFDFKSASKTIFESGDVAKNFVTNPNFREKEDPAKPTSWRRQNTYVSEKAIVTGQVAEVRRKVEKMVEISLDGGMASVKVPKAAVDLIGGRDYAWGLHAYLGKLVMLDCATGGPYRLTLRYRSNHDYGHENNYAYVFIQPVHVDDASGKGKTNVGKWMCQDFRDTGEDSDCVNFWSKDFDVPAGANAIDFTIRFMGAGYLKFTDFQLTERTATEKARRTWYRFWGLTAEEIQPDAAGVAALERAAAEWKSFSDNAAANLARTHAEDDAFFKSVVPKDEKLVLDVDCFGNAVFGERSRARPFDRCVFAANDKVTAKEYSDGGISYGKGKSFWVHPRGLGLQVEGLDTLGLEPDAMLRIRLCTVAEKDEPLSYKVMVRSGWKKILGYAGEGQKTLVWNCPKARTAEGLFTFDVPFRDVTDGVLGIQLRTNQKQILDDWFADGGFIARLERIIVTQVKPEPRTASFADFDARAKAGEKLTVAFFGGSLTWSANATEPNVTGFRGLMAKYLTEKYPASRFTFVDASLGGTGSNLGMFRLERDVLSKKPDLVFLDFSCNDGGENTNVAPTCCYEYLLREMIGRGVPVQQMFFTFKFWAKNLSDAEKGHVRLVPYRKLVEAYGTGVGDVYRDCQLMPDLIAGQKTVDDIWPIDGGHPDDIGYRYFADAGIRGFERAVAEGAVCRVPDKPVFGTVKDLRRWNPVDGALPTGWTRKLTYRTSLWYDGLSSRWMEDVAAFAGAARSPLEVQATGNFFGVFGEADEKALTAEVVADGKPVASFNGYHRAGPGRLFIWRNVVLDGWEDGESRSHRFTIDPVPSADGKGEFHIGSICTATIVPTAKARDAGEASPDALEKLDHARGEVK